MIDPNFVPAVYPEETLARYIIFSKHFSGQKVKPDAFMPHPYQELSVTRHLHATEVEIWTVGRDVAFQRGGKTLYGRADLIASVCIAEGLSVEPAPLTKNPNHANIAGWPIAKESQKVIALEIASNAVFNRPDVD